MITDQLQILVFRSNINDRIKVRVVKRELLSRKDIYSVNIDLKDWEKVLRVECHPEVQSRLIEEQVAKLGLYCAELTS
ncbi:hypothetical protein [Catalinimonas niigatensis]|uniref:hypothetical protein n=1 Tax=Catalinimonas niigatensis TaxID=1397264 RepID=UPI0026660213|nr:hypothetical protein [Catalinimonas niigatensis]WPP51940.1 hypothetical protein PZB72_06015 [Catalinimonas niigatensis]